VGSFFKTMPKIVEDGIVSLIDTGAEHCFISDTLATLLALPVVRSGTINGLDGKIPAYSYKAVVYNKETGKLTELPEIVGRHFLDNDFKVVLGWSFLSRYTLSIAKKTDTVRLEWVGV
jgi:hypothetical protein